MDKFVINQPGQANTSTFKRTQTTARGRFPSLITILRRKHLVGVRKCIETARKTTETRFAHFFNTVISA